MLFACQRDTLLIYADNFYFNQIAYVYYTFCQGASYNDKQTVGVSDVHKVTKIVLLKTNLTKYLAGGVRPCRPLCR